MFKNKKIKLYVKSFTFTMLLLVFVASLIVVDSSTRKTAGYINTGLLFDYNESEISLNIKDKKYTIANIATFKNDLSDFKNIFIQAKNISGIVNMYFTM